jgi:hypothetical protein
LTRTRFLAAVSWRRALVGAFLVILVVYLGFLGRTLWRLRGDALAGQRMLAQRDMAQACPVMVATAGDLSAFAAQAGWLVRLGSAFGWLPRVGGDLSAAPHLLEMAVSLSAGGQAACTALGGPMSAVLSSRGGASTPGFDQLLPLLAALGDARPALQQSAAQIEEAQAAWQQVDQARLSSSLARRAGQVTEILPLLRNGAEAAPLAPLLLGTDRARSYLVLALNDDELRAGGGLISGVGEVKVQNGRVISATFRDSYGVDDFTQPYPVAPEPLHQYMGFDLLVFRDSNWSPDFPTFVKTALPLYRPGHPVDFDGVIALDQPAVAELIDALGELRLPDSAEPVTGDTVLTYMHNAWAPKDGRLTEGWWVQRKSFMNTLAQAAIAQLMGGEANLAKVGLAGARMLEQKHVQVWLKDQAGATFLANAGWDGAMRAEPGDYLMLVDANVGYSKSNLRVRSEVTYTVDLNAQPISATLSLSYRHLGIPRSDSCRAGSRYDIVYERMADWCLKNYRRVFVPSGANLIDATAIPVDVRWLPGRDSQSGQVSAQPAGEGPWVTFSSVGVLQPGETQTTAYHYQLPSAVVEWRGNEGTYRLRVQKQAGASGYPLTVRVLLPAGATMLPGSSVGAKVAGGAVTYSLLLDRDQEIVVYFRR